MPVSTHYKQQSKSASLPVSQLAKKKTPSLTSSQCKRCLTDKLSSRNFSSGFKPKGLRLSQDRECDALCTSCGHSDGREIGNFNQGHHKQRKIPAIVGTTKSDGHERRIMKRQQPHATEESEKKKLEIEEGKLDNCHNDPDHMVNEKIWYKYLWRKWKKKAKKIANSKADADSSSYKSISDEKQMIFHKSQIKHVGDFKQGHCKQGKIQTIVVATKSGGYERQIMNRQQSHATVETEKTKIQTKEDKLGNHHTYQDHMVNEKIWYKYLWRKWKKKAKQIANSKADADSSSYKSMSIKTHATKRPSDSTRIKLEKIIASDKMSTFPSSEGVKIESWEKVSYSKIVPATDVSSHLSSPKQGSLADLKLLGDIITTSEKTGEKPVEVVLTTLQHKALEMSLEVVLTTLQHKALEMSLEVGLKTLQHKTVEKLLENYKDYDMQNIYADLAQTQTKLKGKTYLVVLTTLQHKALEMSLEVVLTTLQHKALEMSLEVVLTTLQHKALEMSLEVGLKTLQHKTVEKLLENYKDYDMQNIYADLAQTQTKLKGKTYLVGLKTLQHKTVEKLLENYKDYDMQNIYADLAQTQTKLKGKTYLVGLKPFQYKAVEKLLELKNAAAYFKRVFDSHDTRRPSDSTGNNFEKLSVKFKGVEVNHVSQKRDNNNKIEPSVQARMILESNIVYINPPIPADSPYPSIPNQNINNQEGRITHGNENRDVPENHQENGKHLVSSQNLETPTTQDQKQDENRNNEERCTTQRNEKENGDVAENLQGNGEHLVTSQNLDTPTTQDQIQNENSNNEERCTTQGNEENGDVAENLQGNGEHLVTSQNLDTPTTQDQIQDEGREATRWTLKQILSMLSDDCRHKSTQESEGSANEPIHHTDICSDDRCTTFDSQEDNSTGMPDHMVNEIWYKDLWRELKKQAKKVANSNADADSSSDEPISDSDEKQSIFHQSQMKSIQTHATKRPSDSTRNKLEENFVSDENLIFPSSEGVKIESWEKVSYSKMVPATDVLLHLSRPTQINVLPEEVRTKFTNRLISIESEDSLTSLKKLMANMTATSEKTVEKLEEVLKYNTHYEIHDSLAYLKKLMVDITTTGTSEKTAEKLVENRNNQERCITQGNENGDVAENHQENGEDLVSSNLNMPNSQDQIQDENRNNQERCITQGNENRDVAENHQENGEDLLSSNLNMPNSQDQIQDENRNNQERCITQGNENGDVAENHQENGEDLVSSNLNMSNSQDQIQDENRNNQERCITQGNENGDVAENHQENGEDLVSSNLNMSNSQDQIQDEGREATRLMIKQILSMLSDYWRHKNTQASVGSANHPIHHTDTCSHGNRTTLDSQEDNSTGMPGSMIIETNTDASNDIFLSTVESTAVRLYRDVIRNETSRMMSSIDRVVSEAVHLFGFERSRIFFDLLLDEELCQFESAGAISEFVPNMVESTVRQKVISFFEHAHDMMNILMTLLLRCPDRNILQQMPVQDFTSLIKSVIKSSLKTKTKGREKLSLEGKIYTMVDSKDFERSLGEEIPEDVLYRLRSGDEMVVYRFVDTRLETHQLSDRRDNRSIHSIYLPSDCRLFIYIPTENGNYWHQLDMRRADRIHQHSR